MATIGDLVVNLGLNRSGYSSGLRSARSQTSGFVSGLRSMMAPVAGMLAGAAAALGAKKSVDAARTQIQAEQKLAAVLKATGGAAGLTAKEIQGYAADLQKVTNFGDEATISAAGMLATFKNIKGDQFKATLASAQDLSAVLGTDLKSSVLQLGKALNDPARGLTALTRSGVSFTAEQKNLIASLQASGDLMGAQQVILDELKNQFGGVAKAMADPLTQAKNVLGDVAELVGFVLMPPLREVMALFTSSVGPLTDNREGFEQLGESIAGVVRNGLVPMIGVFKTAVDVATKVAAGLSHWGLGLDQVIKLTGSLAIAIGAVRIAMTAIIAVQKAIAVGQAIILALSGPKGWAVLAAGAAVAAGAYLALSKTFDGVASAAQGAEAASLDLNRGLAGADDPLGGLSAGANDAQKSIAKLQREIHILSAPESSRRLRELQHEMAELRRGGADEGQVQQFAGLSLQLDEMQRVDAAITSARGEWQRLVDEIEVLSAPESQRGLIEINQQLQKFADAGLPRAFLEDLEEALHLRQQLQEQETLAHEQSEQHKVLELRAQSLLDGLKTPFDHFTDRLAEIAELVNAGLLTAQQGDALAAQARRDFDGPQSTTPRGPSALQAGTREAASAILRAQSGSSNPMAKIQQQGKQHLDESKKQTAHLAALAQAAAEPRGVPVLGFEGGN